MVNLEETVFRIMETGTTQKILSGILSASFKTALTRRALLSAVDRAMYKLSYKTPNRPDRVLEERYYMSKALLHSLDRTLSSGALSDRCMQALWNIFLGKVFVSGIHHRKAFAEKNGFRPPCFVTISPTNVCNLKCHGCYAGDIYTKHTLRYDVFDRALSDIKNEFGAHFFVISGGEPFMYRESGKTLLDILEKHNDAYFMAYTNSTMLNRETVKRLGELGNFTPSISVEGYAGETDQRRGDNVFKRIMEAMDNLREFGVPFGISVTPTRHNAELLLSDEFIDFYFNKHGAFYGWYFQYMPIGRAPDLSLMVTPEQRYRMLQRIWDLVTKRNLFIGDFWNSGTASDGCMAAARGGGYFYIMWDGTITPCVFVPFRDKENGNLYSIYERGKTITDAIKVPLFTEMRDWQNNYWLCRDKATCGNMLTPCLIRDNCEDFYRIVKRANAEPLDEGACKFLSFVEDGRMPAYNRQYREYVDPVWEKEYLRKSA